jgi:hypothetical protein
MSQVDISSEKTKMISRQVDTDGTLDKESTPYNDILDAFRLGQRQV